MYWTGWGNDPLVETDLAGNVLENYVYFNGQRIARRDASTKAVHFYFSDHLGTHSLITDATGDMPPQKESDYYPYGGEIPVSGSDSNHYKFTGKERDSESGFDNFGARYYSSNMGRFSSADPRFVSTQRLFDPQQFNLYTYVRNNALRYIDPTGREIQLAPGMNPSDVAATLALLATQYQKEAQRGIILNAASTAIKNTFGVTNVGVPCNEGGSACGGTGGENKVHFPTKDGRPDASDPSKIRNDVSVDLKAINRQ
jgi:RHS repeat-associated protein